MSARSLGIINRPPRKVLSDSNLQALATDDDLPFFDLEIPKFNEELHHASSSTTLRTNASSAHERTSLVSSSIITNPISNTAAAAAASSTQVKKVYLKDGNKWVTREIAALDFLLGIPLAAEESIVQQGWALQQKQDQEIREQLDPDDEDDEDSQRLHDDTMVAAAATATLKGGAKGKWWEKWVKDPLANNGAGSTTSPLYDNGGQFDELESELPEPVPSERVMINIQQSDHDTNSNNNNNKQANKNAVLSSYVPGRRLEGDEAVRVQIPLTTQTLTKQKMIARQAALREWELQTAHGLKNNGQPTPPLLDGRLFFSASGSYPMSVFSLIRYEPKKEEMQQRRQKLEALGGGGTQFVMPARDWRGISYRSLLRPRRKQQQQQEYNKKTQFNRFLRTNRAAPEDDSRKAEEDDNDNDSMSSVSSGSSSDSHVYVPGLLDDQAMVLGRHRTVMKGDKKLGPIVSSTIQFVKPALLKAELNKKFRERFDGWEPPRGARKYIGAKVVGGEYKLMDPTEEDYHDSSVTSIGGSSDAPSTIVPKEKQLRIPPSLTLSKIRSLKQQALHAAIKGRLEVGTVALACVYFERLCLDCRVDKSNRRLAFAACLLLASKLNEPNVGLVIRLNGESDSNSKSNEGMANRLQSLIRPNKRGNNIFASLLEFFTETWNLSLKHLFDAEWGVFAALGFSLHAKPSHIAFHFKRLMKTLEWNPRSYLGEEMYSQWQSALEFEEERRRERQKRREKMRRRKEEQLLNLRIEMENEVIRRKVEERGGRNSNDGISSSGGQETPKRDNSTHDKGKSPRMSGIRLLNRFGARRARPQDPITSSFQGGDAIPQGGDRLASSEHQLRLAPRSMVMGLTISPSMPNLSTASVFMTSTTPVVPAPAAPDMSGMVAIDIPQFVEDEDDASSIGSIPHSDKGIIV